MSLYKEIVTKAIVGKGKKYFKNNYNIEASFIYSTEAACHLLASLYGLFLIISGQVECNFRNWRRSIVCMFSVIGFGLVLNYIFHTRNFQMDPYGNYSIYMIDIFGSFGATLAAYLLGVLVVLTVGMQTGFVLNKMVSKIEIESLLKGSLEGKTKGDVQNEDEKAEQLTE